MNRRIIGILAHVDAGKTTLSEAMLYESGIVRSLGRVDHKNTFFDTYAQERQRGITIFSKQTEIAYKDIDITLMDTPGHVDFSAETERILQVLDYAILVVSGREGVQDHTKTLAKLLEQYEIPTFIFVNKMDMEDVDKDRVLEHLKKHIGEKCTDFTSVNFEDIALCDDALLEKYMATGEISQVDIIDNIANRNVIPCYFGSALKMQNVNLFMEGLRLYTKPRKYSEDFGARVYKIARDNRGNRLTYMKITGGNLKVKDILKTGENEEKVNQIRLYSGEKFEQTLKVSAGEVCAVTGFDNTFAGQGLGIESRDNLSLLTPVLTYKVLPMGNINISQCYAKLKELDEEEPELNILWDEVAGEINIQLMGQVHLEVIGEMIKDRFGFEVEFGNETIAYRETVEKPSVGIGHFEPLKHYAEVHLLLEPAERGSGIVLDTICDEDQLDRNYQRLILSHLDEKVHRGILADMPLTDMKITLIAGRAHPKHTEGGDFRQATYRALRNGLMNGSPILLEPWYDFTLTLPQEAVGRAMADIEQMSGTFETPEIQGDESILKGTAPVSKMKNYGVTLTSYTGGKGSMQVSVSGYKRCHNEQEVIGDIGYDCNSDINNTGDSIFCQKGSGYNVPWDKVKEYAHITEYKKIDGFDKNTETPKAMTNFNSFDSEDLEQIFERTYGKQKDRTYKHQEIIRPVQKKTKIAKTEIKDEYILVDGYNIIFAWQEFKELAKVNFDGARQALIEVLSNYRGYKNCKLIVVFDAYKVKGGERRHEKHSGIDVIYTKESETADAFIERFTYENAKDYYVRVATSDNLEQMIIIGNGAFKISADEFYKEVKETEEKIADVIAKYNRESYLNSRTTIGDKLK